MSHANRIIFIDDNPQDLQLLEYALDQNNLANQKILHYEDGYDFLAAVPDLYSPNIACILVDLNMPRVGGFDVIAALRSKSEFEYIPIIVFTSTDSNEEKKKSYQLGANAFIVKPTGLDAFVDIVNHTVHFWVNTNARVF